MNMCVENVVPPKLLKDSLDKIIVIYWTFIENFWTGEVRIDSVRVYTPKVTNSFIKKVFWAPMCLHYTGISSHSE
jgi:hypothetical protein